MIHRLLKPVVRFGTGRNGPFPRIVRSRKTRARRAVCSFVIGFVALTLILSVLINGPLDRLRDPEFAARRDRLVIQQSEHPTRPLILVLGSSRAVEGIRPDAINQPSGPLLLNGGLIGSGPMLELIAYRRLKAAGLKPAAVLLEYWPPLLRGENHAEYGRIDLPRLAPRDLRVVWEYFPDPVSVTRYVLEGQLWPAWRYRHRFVAAVRPKWVPNSSHDQRFANGIDAWGWWPGMREQDIEEHRRTKGFDHYKAFAPMLDHFRVGEKANRAIRDLLCECRDDGVAVAMIVMPEGKRFRDLYTPEADREWQTHLNQLSAEFELPVLNTRTWDEFAPEMPDHVHLIQEGATRFTRRLGEELPRLFPSLYHDPSTPVVP